MESKYYNIRITKLIRPGYILILALILGVLIFFSTYLDMRSKKTGIYHLMKYNSESLILSISSGAANTVISDREIENLIYTHLLSTIRNVARIDSLTAISNEVLHNISSDNYVYRINIFDGNGKKIFSNVKDSAHKTKSKHSPKEYISSILSGENEEIIIGLKESRFEDGMRYAVAKKRPENRNGAIVVNLNADSYLDIREKTGFGKMITDIGNNPEIEYIVLQDKDEIIAANKNVNALSSITDDAFLKEALKDTAAYTREIVFDGRRTFEVVKKFDLDSLSNRLFRIGIKTDHIEEIENTIFKRFILLTIIVIVLSVLAVSLVMVNQNYKFISDEYKNIKTYTGEILENMSQALITIDKEGIITIFNHKAGEIFSAEPKEVIGKNIHEVLSNYHKDLDEIIKKKIITNNLELITKEGKVLLIYTSMSSDPSGGIYAFSIVLDDISDFKAIEKKKKMDERLVAMGELASAVAHEVRNPLNTINMIAQRFDKNYESIENNEKNSMTQILKSESERVNNIIKEFLKFSKPPKVKLSVVNLIDFFDEIKSISEVILKDKKTKLKINCGRTISASIDAEQMKQVFINLIQNSNDAIVSNGEINIDVMKQDNFFVFSVKDNGSGIRNEIIDKIFNLYFTSKSNGTGLGLSIVQQIISQHNGIISVGSKLGFGTEFLIKIPIE